MELLEVLTNITDWVFGAAISLTYPQKKAPSSLKRGKKGLEMKVGKRPPRVPLLILVPVSDRKND